MVAISQNYENLRSECCDAEVSLNMSPDFLGDKPESMTVGTGYFVCKECNEHCDVYEEKFYIELIKEYKELLFKKRDILDMLLDDYVRRVTEYMPKDALREKIKELRDEEKEG